MKEQIARKVGSAFFWKAVQHTGVKVIFLVRLLVLARLLSPDDFGLLAVSMVAVGIMNRVTDFGMIPALVQRPAARDAHYHTAWTVGIIRALTIAAVVLLAAPFVARLFTEPRAAVIMQVLAILPLLEASASIKVAELVRTLRFRTLTFIKLPEALTNTIIAIALAPSLGVWALVAGALAGPTAMSILSYFLAPYRPRFSLDRQAARALIQFGRWIFLIGLIAVLGNSVLRLVITRQLGTAELGLYFLGASLAFLPADVASQVIGDVTFSLYARLQGNREKATRAFTSVLTGLFAVLTPICTLLIALAPPVVENVLGPKWEGTVPVIRILALASMIGLLGETIVPILKGMGRPSKVVVMEGVQTLLLIAGVVFFTRYWGLAGAALAWLPAIAISQLIGSKYARDLLPHAFAGLLKPFSVIAGIAVVGALFASGIYQMIPGLTGLMLGIALTAAGTGLVLWIADRWLALGLVDDLARAFPQVATLVGYISRKDRPVY